MTSNWLIVIFSTSNLPIELCYLLFWSIGFYNRLKLKPALLSLLWYATCYTWSVYCVILDFVYVKEIAVYVRLQLSKERLCGDSKPEDIVLDTGVKPFIASFCGRIYTWSFLILFMWYWCQNVGIEGLAYCSLGVNVSAGDECSLVDCRQWFEVSVVLLCCWFGDINAIWP